ncbi:catenin (Cadherin-associated protein), alpha 3 [Elysia marginata]|uniref:Catenin (Cadherin-associated protein), alpha 3 n=1 Tax=Elysia marginata TaxID=1093978 RepID=A0AAV4EGH4_9GAST|nr:catenin (Cadherin-associated protein), alpha 3 [Elysia marginata]
MSASRSTATLLALSVFFILSVQSGTVVKNNSTTNPTISEEAKSRSRRNEKHELSPPATISVNPTTVSLSKTWRLLRQVAPQLGNAILNGQPLTPQQNKVLADFAKQLGSSISQLPNLLQGGGNSTLDLLKILRDSGLLRALTGSNTPVDPTSEPYTVDWLKCRTDLLMMANGIATRQMWALQMLDSWGKPESSILKGNTAFLGNNAECRSVHYTNTKTFANVQGNMCRMSIYLEATRDDTALMSDNITSMRRILHWVDESGKKAGLKLNAKKTKVMQLKPENSLLYDVKIDQTVLENVEDFKYLGFVKTIDGSCSKDIKMRIGMAKKKMIELNNVWKDHNFPIELKLKLLKFLIWPVMMYGCEAWSQKKDDD